MKSQDNYESFQNIVIAQFYAPWRKNEERKYDRRVWKSGHFK